MTTRRLMVCGLLCGLAMLGGCSTTPTYGPRYVEVVRVEPPPPRIEVYGSPPVVGHVWISGYWNWGGARYVWVPGRWEAPRDGHHWVPHRWERDGDHWRQHGGYWERGRMAEPVRPPVVHQRPHVEMPRTESRELHDRRDWGNRQDVRPEVRQERRQERHEERREERREGPRMEHRDGARIDARDRSERNVVAPQRDAPPPVVVSRQEPARPVVEAPRVNATPAPEMRRDNRAEHRTESRGEERRRERNDNDERRERGRGREGN